MANGVVGVKENKIEREKVRKSECERKREVK